MDAKEFKAWFEGFYEGVGDAPTAEQWAKLKQKAGTLAGPLDNLKFPNDPLAPDAPRRWREAVTARYDARPFPPEAYAKPATAAEVAARLTDLEQQARNAVKVVNDR